MSGPYENLLRCAILRLLRTLGDPAAQLANERDVPIACVPAELVCMWFDDLYNPTMGPFWSAFHERFRVVADSLPADLGRVAGLHAHERWRALMGDAVDTLRDLSEHAV